MRYRWTTGVLALAATLPFAASATGTGVVTACVGGETDVHAIAFDDDLVLTLRDAYARDGWLYLSSEGQIGLQGDEIVNTAVWVETNTVEGLQKSAKWCQDYYQNEDGSLTYLASYLAYGPDTPLTT